MARLLLLLLVFSVFLPSLLLADEPTAEGIAFFETKIRPVLAEQCYQCHSEKALAEKKLQGELLLDTRAGIRKGGESGPAVVPGDLEASLLISAIRHDSFEMPPKSKLSEATIADFQKWVEMGAPDPREGPAAELAKAEIDIEAGRAFWSFRPLASSLVPEVKNKDWVKTNVDPFILAPLEAKGLSPNQEASRRTLIRRLYIDLWGLPPRPAEVEAFLQDESPQAYEKLVDRLLASEHFGERWARHWLDLARFAESNGYAFDLDRPAAYHYRDFLIKAFNQNLPYDQFVRLQLAGDQINPTSDMAQAATGFLAAGPFTSQQTQKERERSRYEQLDDVVGTIGTSMLGLTIGCARCHDHKFDPLPVHDYYRFTACFAETGFQDFDFDKNPAATKAAKEKFDAEHQPYLDARAKYEREELPKQLNDWINNRGPQQSEKLSDWHLIGPFPAADFKTAISQAFAPETEVDLTKTYDQLKWTPQPAWVDGQVHNTLTGENSANYLFRTIEVAEARALEISLGRDDAIKVWHNSKEVLTKEAPGAAAPDQDVITLQLTAGVNHLLLKVINAGGPSGFYFSTSAGIPKNIQDILNLAQAERNDKQQQELLKWYQPRDAKWSELNQAEQEHAKQAPKPNITKIYAARKNGSTYNFGGDTYKVYFLARGNSNSKQGLASPGFLRVLTEQESPMESWMQQGSGENGADIPPRIALGNWITDTEAGAGHLLARVMVNRIWQHHLGRGIVATPSDFGKQGAPPTHPQLLDYLATELIESNWNLKQIHKLILMSAVYRQSGENNEAAARLDPENKLWWRRGAVRLEGEVIRDTLLAVSGSLDKQMFGPGSLDQASPRRSIYLTVKRSNLIPMLQLFDGPDAMQSIGQRNVTTVPPQALAMMNSPLVRQFAEKFAQRIRPSAEVSLEEVVQAGYEQALARPPRDTEKERMAAFITSQAESYGGNEPALQRAVADYCQLMFCLNEFVFVD